MGRLKILKVKMLATIQDHGRFGYRKYGIPQSGAMDVASLNQANYLVGNRRNSAGIEISLQGLILQAQAATAIALSGAEVVAKINETQISMYHSYELKPLDTLIISAPLNGVYTYLGIGGALQGQYDFGSIATYLMAGFGGLEGRPLEKGDELRTIDDPPFYKRSIAYEEEALFNKVIIRYMQSPESACLQTELDEMVFTIGRESNRMGIRLEGHAVSSEVKEIVSSAVTPGMIQLLPDGSPIVLMKDCQTTGGYPRIGKVLDADLGKLAQLMPGTSFTFKKVSQGLHC